MMQNIFTGAIELVERVRRWVRIEKLRADIAGHEEDLATVRMLGLSGTKTERMVERTLAEARVELFLCQRKAAVKTITN